MGLAGLVLSLIFGIHLGEFKAVIKDTTFHENHVEKGGCLKDFQLAIRECNPPKDVEKCVRATAALRECFAKNPEMFKHMYLPRMDYGLDEDLKPSKEKVNKESCFSYRWWTGMRRS